MQKLLSRIVPAPWADLLTGLWYAILVFLTVLFAFGDQPAFRYLSL